MDTDMGMVITIMVTMGIMGITVIINLLTTISIINMEANTIKDSIII
jgi:hypothetical protein